MPILLKPKIKIPKDVVDSEADRNSNCSRNGENGKELKIKAKATATAKEDDGEKKQKEKQNIRPTKAREWTKKK